ncbi:MAG: hypothetical protein ACKVJ2_11425 [Pseudomonadales bacterium]
MSALTDGLITLSYLTGLEAVALISGVLAGDATSAPGEALEEYLKKFLPKT